MSPTMRQVGRWATAWAFSSRWVPRKCGENGRGVQALEWAAACLSRQPALCGRRLVKGGPHADLAAGRLGRNAQRLVCPAPVCYRAVAMHAVVAELVDALA